MSISRIFRHNSVYDPFSLITFEGKIVEIEEKKVLDHGYVKYINHMGNEESIIEAARMSTDKGFLGWGPLFKHEKTCEWMDGSSFPLLCDCPSEKGDEKLLEYLYKNHHETPFEMCELLIEVKAPIMVFREWHRHRTQSYNEMSGRYIQMPDEHYVPAVRMQDKNNKQGSIEFANGLKMDQKLFWEEIWKDEQKIVYKNNDAAIHQGIAKEVARINTPISRYSKMRAKANLRNWLAFLNLRMRENAQWEIRQYANAVASIVKFLWPRTYSLFEEYTLFSHTLSKTEFQRLKGE